MVKIRQAIVVEGRYDKNTLSQIVDAPIFETSGFGIMKNKETLQLLRQIAAHRGLIILTDSDGAGFVIRSFLKGALPASQVKHAYIPDCYGKEARKRAPGKEGKLGVEGMTPEVLLRALKAAGADFESEDSHRQQTSPITTADLFVCGLSGGKGSKEKRRSLLQALQLPEHLTTPGLLQVLNILYTKDQFLTMVSEFEETL